MKVSWEQALKVESMLGRGEACLYGSSECGGVDGQITRDTWSTRTRKRCFQVWLYWRSTLTLTQWWKKRAKRGRRWDENIATVVRKWRTRRQSGGEGRKWLWMANPVRRIYKRQHDGFIWILHDLKTGQLSGWYGKGPSRRTWSIWWLLMGKPDLQWEMQPAAKKSRAASYSLYQTSKSLLQLQPPSFQVSAV